MTGRWQVIHGNSLEVLRRFPANTAHAVICDPPAWIRFMGRSWDTAKGYGEFREIMAECHRILRPGGHAVVWALPRTSWMTAAGMDAAGIEIRDRIHHVFGSGMPHALDASKAIDAEILGAQFAREHGRNPTKKEIGKLLEAARPVIGTYRVGGNALTSTKEKGGTYGIGAPNSEAGELTRTTGATPEAQQWDGWASNLKPGCEDWWIGRKELDGTLAENLLKWGCGALNIDATRVPRDWDERGEAWAKSGHADPNSTAPSAGDKIAAPPGQGMILHPGGGWPANLALTHSRDCEPDACADDCPVRALDEANGIKKSGSGNKNSRNRDNGLTKGDGLGKGYGLGLGGDSGFVSRYFNVFYATKVATKEREAGCEGIPLSSAAQNTKRKEGQEGINRPQAGAGRTGGRHNSHPTVKNKSLMEHLCSLVTPAGGLIVDPYCGSGSTGCAAVPLGFDFIGIERGPCEDDPTPSVEIARARIAHWAAQGAR